ncbi:ubiquinone biosynthesis O-methyltransferase [Clostridiales bacterium]|nr:ubiquinone biosynthesis O-methyltransferase [Clostridiales bacterium]
MMESNREIIEHYDMLVDENNDPVHDPKQLRDYMNKWDGGLFLNSMELDQFKSVLEIGCGTGRLAVQVAPLCAKFCGIDISPKTIQRAKENLSMSNNVMLICDDFMEHSFDSSFDIIYSSLTFFHFQDKQAAIYKTASLLNENGRFILSLSKNQDAYIDMGERKILIYPDNFSVIKKYITNAHLNLIKCFETEFAYILIIIK